MQHLPYKHYLQLIEKTTYSKLHKFSFFVFGFLFLIAGSLSTHLWWQYQKEQPILAENQYLEVALGGFKTTTQSLDEVMEIYQVLGTKVKIIDLLKEASESASGFFIPLDDVNKVLGNIEAVRGNTRFQKEILAETTPPQKFAELENELIAFYDESEKALDNLYQEQKFTREILLNLGPNFYLPVLTNESLWQFGKTDEIKGYYEQTKKEAEETLAKLTHLTPPGQFQDYHATQIAYLELLVETATQITQILSEEDAVGEENVTQLEKAYQMLNSAKGENEAISEKLLIDRLKLLSPEENFAKLASVNIHKNALQAKLTDFANTQQQPTNYMFFIIKKLLDSASGIKTFIATI